jgi:hypothetical protein
MNWREPTFPQSTATLAPGGSVVTGMVCDGPRTMVAQRLVKMTMSRARIVRMSRDLTGRYRT